MFQRPSPDATRRSRFAAVVITGALLLAGCGDGGGDETAQAASPAPSPVATTTTTFATTTTTATTSTTEPTTTTSPSTSVATTTTLVPETTLSVQETEPIAPPVDAHADEPVIEVGTLTIPKIDVEMTMYEGIRLTTLDFGPGHWPGTALPGQIGNVVVGGHRTSNHRVFRNVDQLAAGDEIIFTDDNGVHTYAVDRVEIIEPTDVWIIDPTPTATATLFACHPPGSTSQRIAVFADLVTD